MPLLGPQGIFKPRIFELPLSITSIPNGPYDDGYSSNGQLLYKYRGMDPNHHENVGLRTAMHSQTPLVYFFRVVPGKYLVEFPVFIVGDNPANLTFNIQVDDKLSLEKIKFEGEQVEDEGTEEIRRRYITALVRQRVHQKTFRERVLKAYMNQCALCNLRHEELLDAAHIVPDSDPEGVASVNNGLALCKIHHAAFDCMFIGIRPDRIVIVRHDLLLESDGPMLRHGLQGVHMTSINIPKRKLDWPSEALLDSKFQAFESQSLR